MSTFSKTCRIIDNDDAVTNFRKSVRKNNSALYHNENGNIVKDKNIFPSVSLVTVNHIHPGENKVFFDISNNLSKYPEIVSKYPGILDYAPIATGNYPKPVIEHWTDHDYLYVKVSNLTPYLKRLVELDILYVDIAIKDNVRTGWSPLGKDENQWWQNRIVFPSTTYLTGSHRAPRYNKYRYRTIYRIKITSKTDKVYKKHIGAPLDRTYVRHAVAFKYCQHKTRHKFYTEQNYTQMDFRSASICSNIHYSIFKRILLKTRDFTKALSYQVLNNMTHNCSGDDEHNGQMQVKCTLYAYFCMYDDYSHSYGYRYANATLADHDITAAVLYDVNHPNYTDEHDLSIGECYRYTEKIILAMTVDRYNMLKNTGICENLGIDGTPKFRLSDFKLVNVTAPAVDVRNNCISSYYLGWNDHSSTLNGNFAKYASGKTSVDYYTLESVANTEIESYDDIRNNNNYPENISREMINSAPDVESIPLIDDSRRFIKL